MLNRFRDTLALGLILLGVLGCETNDPVTPDAYGGWLEGRVSDGAPADIAGRHVLIRHWDEQGAEREYRAHIDADGYFRIGVPRGRAVVAFSWAATLFYRADGPTFESSEAETLQVDGGIQRADFNCGRLRIEIAEVPEMPSRQAYVKLYRIRPDDGFSGSLGGRFMGYDDGILSADFRFMAAGAVIGRFRWDESSARYYLPDSYHAAEADTLVLAAGALTTYTTTVPEPATLTGTMVGTWREFDFQPPLVQFVTDDGTAGVARCDADGRFSVVAPAAGDFRLKTSVSDTTYHGTTIRRWVGGLSHDDATVFTLACGQTISGLVEHPGGLELTLQGELGTERVRINFYDQAGQEIYGCSHWDHEPAVVKIPNLNPGFYRVGVYSDGLAMPVYHDGATSLDDSTPLEIRADEISRLSLELVRGGRIRGRLLGADGTALAPFFRIGVYEADSEDVAYFSAGVWFGTDSGRVLFDELTGDFEVRQLPAGDYKLRLWQSGGDSFWYPGVVDWPDATLITVPEGGDTEVLVWQL